MLENVAAGLRAADQQRLSLILTEISPGAGDNRGIYKTCAPYTEFLLPHIKPGELHEAFPQMKRTYVPCGRAVYRQLSPCSGPAGLPAPGIASTSLSLTGKNR